VERRFPQLRGRIVAYTVPGGAGTFTPGEQKTSIATFRDPETAGQVRKLVISMLGLGDATSKD
jgi:hypothetical protein